MAQTADTHQDVFGRILGGAGGKLAATSMFSQLPMSVSTTSISILIAHASRYRDMEPFPPNQGIKPTAPLQKQLSVFATDPARGLSLSR